MNKFFKFLNDYKYIIFTILIYIILFCQMQNVYFYGDDFQVLYPLKNEFNIENMFSFLTERINFFWFKWSGRIIGHTVVTFVLSFLGINFYRLMLPIMLFLFCFMLLKILELFRKFNFWKYMFLYSSFLISLTPLLSRELLYWPYSGILYIGGAILILCAIYIYIKNYIESNKKILSYVLVITLSLIATFFLEQLSIIFILFLCTIIYDSFKKKNIKKETFILIIISFIALLVTVLAPGNSYRTGDLSKELEGINLIIIILCKIHSFFNILFNFKYLGVYFLILNIILIYKYKGRKKFSFLLVVTSLIYIVLFIYDQLSIYNADTILITTKIFSFYDYGDSLNLNNLNLNLLLIKTIFLFGYFINLTILFINQRKYVSKFTIYSLIISLISTFVPLICVRYLGTRYYFYFYAIIFLLIIELLDKKIFNNKNRIFLYFIIFFISIFMVYNLITTMLGYKKNMKIIKYNEFIIENSSNNEEIVLREIPYKDTLYTWHSIYMDYSGYHTYYLFYLGDFYSNYYGVDLKNIKIITD